MFSSEFRHTISAERRPRERQKFAVNSMLPWRKKKHRKPLLQVFGHRQTNRKNLCRIFNSKKWLRSYETKLSNLQLKTRPGQLLDIMLPVFYGLLGVKSFSLKIYMFRGGGGFRQLLDLLRLIFDFGLLVPLLSKLFFFVADEATKLSRVFVPRTCFGLIR